MAANKNIHVFWWSSVKFENKSQENFGDILSKYLVERISGKTVVWKFPKNQRRCLFKKRIYFTTGSILAHVDKKSIVWGSGIISKQDPVAKATFLAVRGPETYQYLTSLGYTVNKVFGDPAILLPNLYQPKTTKQYTLGIIPHYVDYETALDWYKNDVSVKVINLLNNDVEAVIDEIASCEQIISSSLHGVIVSHTYQIPAVWVAFSNKLSGDGVKFVDYFKSVGLTPYKPTLIQERLETHEALTLITQYPNLPKEDHLKELRDKLMEVCPFGSER